MADRGPMLAPSQLVNLDTLQYPVYVSVKMDGVRALIINGEILSRKLKPLHPETTRYFQPLVNFTKNNQVVLDGELYCEGLNFSELTSCLADSNKLRTNFVAFNAFDCIPVDEWFGKSQSTFQQRTFLLGKLMQRWTSQTEEELELLFAVMQHQCTSAEEVNAYAAIAYDNRYEGLIIRNIGSTYKHGRATVRESSMWKMKAFTTVRARIIGFNYKTVLHDGASLSYDRMGYKERTHKAEDRVLIDEIGSIDCEISDGNAFPIGTKFSATYVKDCPLRSMITPQTFEQYRGKECLVSYQQHGSKDKPRFPRIVRLTID